MSHKSLTPDEFYKHIRSRGLTMVKVLTRAKVSPSTFQKWKNGGDIMISTYDAIIQAADDLSKAKERS